MTQFEQDPRSAFDKLAAVFSSYSQATAKAEQIFSPIVQHFLIAGKVFELRFAGDALIAPITQSLRHQAIEPPSHSSVDYRFTLADSASTGIYPEAPPFAASEYQRFGKRVVVDTRQYAVMHSPNDGILFAYNRAERQGVFWTPKAEQLSIYDRAAPLQTLLHWALSEHNWHIVHAAALGTENGGVLLVGNSGAGKSSTALSCLEHSELKYLSDDKCLVSLEGGASASCIYNAGKLKDDMLGRFPHLHALAEGRDIVNGVGKNLVFLHPAYQQRMVRTLRLKAIVIPRIRHRDSPMLSPATPADAFRVLGPSSVIWMPGAETGHYAFLARLTHALPCLFLDLAKNPTDNLTAIQQVITQHS